MTDQLPLELRDDLIERMLAQRAGPGAPDDLVPEIASAIGATPQRRPRLVPPIVLPRSARSQVLLIAAALALAGLAATVAIVGSNLKREQNNLTVVPTPSILATPSLAPTASPTRAPAAASWNATGSLLVAHSQDAICGLGPRPRPLGCDMPSAHDAVLLADGRVLVAGGIDNFSDIVGSAQLFDPGTATWASTAHMTTERLGHTATLLANGRVLVAGGRGPTSRHTCCDLLASAEVYDPIAGTWTATGSMLQARQFHSATLLPDGRVLVVGGVGILPDPAPRDELKSAEIYDPSTGDWSATGSMTRGRFGHAATLLRDGTVLVEGEEFGTASAELYDTTTGTWRRTGSMIEARGEQTATLLPDGTVLVTGGQDRDQKPLVTAEIYDPTKASWTATGSMQSGLVAHTATLLGDGKILVVGAYGKGFSKPDVELYDPETGAWTGTAKSSIARVAHVAVLLVDGRVLVAGGGAGGRAQVPVVSEIYDPGDLP
jgi:N-acetylneuraminic acid mutarotase